MFGEDGGWGSLEPPGSPDDDSKMTLVVIVGLVVGIPLLIGLVAVCGGIAYVLTQLG